MAENTHESRQISTVRTETKIAVILGLCLVGLAAYFYFTPVYLLKAEGGIFGCGSPASPNTDAKNICGAPEGVSQARAYTALGIGVMVIVLGFALFGLGGARNVVAEDEMDDDDEIDLSSDRRARGGSSSERDEPADGEREVGESRSSRRASGRRSVLRDDDFADPAPRERVDDDLAEPSPRRRADDDLAERPRRRTDDDWASDGWR